MAACVTAAALTSIALMQDEEDRKRKLCLPAEVAANLLNLVGSSGSREEVLKGMNLR